VTFSTKTFSILEYIYIFLMGALQLKGKQYLVRPRVSGTYMHPTEPSGGRLSTFRNEYAASSSSSHLFCFASDLHKMTGYKADGVRIGLTLRRGHVDTTR
jgi:hypothetical protein